MSSISCFSMLSRRPRAPGSAVSDQLGFHSPASGAGSSDGREESPLAANGTDRGQEEAAARGQAPGAKARAREHDGGSTTEGLPRVEVEGVTTEREDRATVENAMQDAARSSKLQNMLEKKGGGGVAVSEEVVNELQCLLQPHAQFVGAARKEPALLGAMMKAHERVMASLPELTGDSKMSVLALLDATRLALCFVEAFFACSGNNENKEISGIIFGKQFVEYKTKWVALVTETRKRLKRMSASLMKRNAPLLVLNSKISLLETAIVALKDPNEKSKALMAVGKALFSVAKSVAQMSLDKNLLSDFATVGGMALEKLKQTNALRIYIAVHDQNESKLRLLQMLSAERDHDSEQIRDELRALQTRLMANPSADLTSNFVDVIFELLLGTQPIQLKASKKIVPVPAAAVSHRYNILGLDTALALWLIKGDEGPETSDTDAVATTGMTPFLGLRGLSSFGLKNADKTPEPSVRFKIWGKECMASFYRAEMDSYAEVSSFREIVQDDFLSGMAEFRSNLQATLHEQAELAYEFALGEFVEPMLRYMKLSEVMEDGEQFNPQEMLTWLQVGDVAMCSGLQERLAAAKTKTVRASRKDLVKVEGALVRGKDFLVRIRGLTKTVLDMLDKGIAFLTKCLSFFKPALQLMRTVVKIAKDLLKGKNPAASAVEFAASAAMAKLTALSTMSPAFERAARAKIQQMNAATSGLASAAGGSSELRAEMLELIEKEIRGESGPDGQDGEDGVLGDAAVCEEKLKAEKTTLLRQIFLLTEGAADDVNEKSGSMMQEMPGDLVPADALLVLNSTIRSMGWAQAAIEQKISELESAKGRVEGSRNKLDTQMMPDCEKSLDQLRGPLSAGGSGEGGGGGGGDLEVDVDMRLVAVGGVALAVAACTAVQSLRREGDSMLVAFGNARQAIGGMECRPVRLSGAPTEQMNGIYCPTPLCSGEKPEFRNGAYVLSYCAEGDEPGWGLAKATLSTDGDQGFELMSNSEVHLPHLMDAEYCSAEGKEWQDIVWKSCHEAAHERVPVLIHVVQTKLSAGFDFAQMTDQVKAKCRDCADAVASAAQDLLSGAYAECEEKFQNAKEEISNMAEDMGEITLDTADLMCNFQPLQSVAGDIAKVGWAICQQRSAQKELFRVRATSFFVLVQLKACLRSAIAARNNGIGRTPVLDLSAALKAVDALIVRMSSLETEPKMKRFFKCAEFAGEAWKHRNTGYRDLHKEQADRVDELSLLIHEMAHEQDPEKKRQLASEIEHQRDVLEKKALEKNVDPMLYSLLINQAKTVADISAAGTTAAAGGSSALSKDAWDDEKKAIEAELRLNLASLKKQQEQLECDADIDAKQALMMQVRQEQLAITTQLSNVEDVGAGLGVPVSFLQGLQGQLDTINNKLDVLAAVVQETADNVRMIVGRPVMEVLEGQRTDFIAKRRGRLPDSVYIPCECLELVYQATVSGQWVHGKHSGVPGFLHHSDKGVAVFACEDGEDIKLIGVKTESFDDEERTMISDHHRVAKGQQGKVDLKDPIGVIQLYDDVLPGTVWVDAGSQKPEGTLIMNDGLAKALQNGQLTFTREELEEFGLNLGEDLAADSFVRELAGEEETAEGKGKYFTMQKPRTYKEWVGQNHTVFDVLKPQSPLMDKMKAFLAKPGEAPYDAALSDKGVMLVHGPAGSGKTLFSRELEHYILKDYFELRQKEGTTVVLIKSQLSVLEKPLTNLFWETMQRQYHLRDVQIHSLMDKILDEKEDFECIFLLDSYDEMRPEFRNKNVFMTNNLENFRNGGGKAENYNYPKVIYLSRSELFAGQSNYQRPFYPIEADNEKKDEDHEAVSYFHELKIASFEDNMHAYLASHSALKLRAAYERTCGPFSPTAPMYKEALEETVLNFLKNAKSDETKVAVFAMAKAMTAEGEILKGQKIPEAGEGDDDVERAKEQMRYVVGMLDAFRTCESCPDQGRAGMPKLTTTQTRDLVEDALANHVWTQRMFVSRIQDVPGLVDLTSTPFMVKIVSDIIHILHSLSASPSDVKQQMLLLLGSQEEMAEKTWALLRKVRPPDTTSSSPSSQSLPLCPTISGSVEHLARTQAILKKGSKHDSKKSLLKLLDNIAEQVQLKLRKGAADSKGEADARKHWGTLREAVMQPALTTEEAEAKENLKKILHRVLQQKPTRRFAIYSVFLTQLVSQQAAAKLSGRFGIALSLDKLIAEVWDYMQRFASFLLEMGMAKVRYDPGSVLFARTNELSRFFDFRETTNNLGEIRRLVLDVSPITKEGVMFSFSHKSILEFLVAKQVRDGMIQCVHHATSSSLSLHRLSSVLQDLFAATVGQDASLDAGSVSVDIVWLEKTLKSLADAGKLTKLKSKGSDARRVAKLLLDLVQDIVDSTVARIDLEEEEAVRDFLIDALLDDVEFCAALRVVNSVCRLAWLHGGLLSGLAYDNILITCTGKSPKRQGAHLAVVAVKEDNAYLLETAIDVIKGAADRLGAQQVEEELLGAALVVSSRDGDLDEMRVLIQAGASVDAVDADGRTSLQWVCKNCQAPKCAELLILHKADVTVKDDPKAKADTLRNSETLLGLVAKAGSSGNSCGLMRVLLQHGAEIDAANANESTPLLQYAFASKVQGGDEEDANDEQIVNFLLDQGAEIDKRNKFKNSALKMIVKFGGSHVVMRTLLNRGADPNIKDGNRDSPLLNLVACNPLRGVTLMRLLLEAKADVDCKELKTCLTKKDYYNETKTKLIGKKGIFKREFTPLLLLCSLGHECAEEIGLHWVCLGSARPENTPIDKADRYEIRHSKLAEALQHKAPFTNEEATFTNEEYKALSVPIGALWEDIGPNKPGRGTELEDEKLAAALLGKLQSSPGKAVQFADEELSDFNLARVSYSSYIKVTVSPDSSTRYLQPAACLSTDVEGFGVSSACYIEAAGQYYQPAGAQLLRLLLEHGADKERRVPGTKETPLIVAAKAGDSRGHLAHVRLLLQAGANINAKSNDKKTALMHAKAKKHLRCAALLEAHAKLKEEDAKLKEEDAKLKEEDAKLKEEDAAADKAKSEEAAALKEKEEESAAAPATEEEEDAAADKVTVADTAKEEAAAAVAERKEEEGAAVDNATEVVAAAKEEEKGEEKEEEGGVKEEEKGLLEASAVNEEGTVRDRAALEEKDAAAGNATEEEAAGLKTKGESSAGVLAAPGVGQAAISTLPLRDGSEHTLSPTPTPANPFLPAIPGGIEAAISMLPPPQVVTVSEGVLPPLSAEVMSDISDVGISVMPDISDVGIDI